MTPLCVPTSARQFCIGGHVKAKATGIWSKRLVAGIWRLLAEGATVPSPTVVYPPPVMWLPAVRFFPRSREMALLASSSARCCHGAGTGHRFISWLIRLPAIPFKLRPVCPNAPLMSCCRLAFFNFISSLPSKRFVLQHWSLAAGDEFCCTE